MSFPRAIPLEQAAQLIEQTASQQTLSTQTIPLVSAVGRWTAADVLAPQDVPAFDCSRMDGYAINFQQYQASQGATMPLGDAIHAGRQLTDRYCHQQAVPIMTGGKLPVDATTVVIKEQTTVKGDQLLFQAEVKDAAHIRRQGSDVTAGQVLVPAHTRLKTTHLGLLASVGLAQLSVKDAPRVALMMTGDELVQPGEPCAPGQIYDANSTMLQLLLQQLGCQVTVHPPLPDTQAAVQQRMQQLLADAYDLVLSVGGVSMGDKDWVPGVLQDMGRIVFHKVQVKPGFPLLFGQLGTGLYFGLPGNPVSAFTSLCQFVVPALAAMHQVPAASQGACAALLTQDINKGHDRHEFMRARYQMSATGLPEVTVAGGQQSSRIESMVEANCFLVLDAGERLYRAGDTVTIQPFAAFVGDVL